jgi:hypothetical protein
MSKRIILGIQITNRVDNVPEVQKVLSQYGCNIRTRLGLHEVAQSACSEHGLLIIETYGDDAAIHAMEASLQNIKGLVVKKMEFDC